MPLIPVTMLANLGNAYGVDGGKVTGVLEFDLLLSESHNFQSTVTQHPIENGREVTDHIKNHLRTGSLTGLVSAYSIKLRTFTSLGDRIKSPFSFMDAEQNAYDTLEKIWQARTPITIVTLMRVYKDVAITDMKTAKSAEDGRSITFSISFKELKKVSLKRLEVTADVEVNDLDSNLSKQASPAENAGRQGGF